MIVLGLAFNIGFAVLDRAGWGIDFNQFYSSGRLAGTGHLYEWEALRKIEAENGTGVPTGRLPVVAYGYKLLAWLPYPAAHWTWLVHEPGGARSLRPGLAGRAAPMDVRGAGMVGARDPAAALRPGHALLADVLRGRPAGCCGRKSRGLRVWHSRCASANSTWPWGFPSCWRPRSDGKR